MTTLPLKQAIVGALSLALAAPMAPLPTRAQGFDPDKPSDGVVSPVACRVFGFTLPEERFAPPRPKPSGSWCASRRRPWGSRRRRT